jgi:HEAT repeat protein
MNRLYLLSWYYQGQDGESSARDFFGKLRAGIENGKKFPFDCPSEVGLVHCKIDEHWCVGVLAMRGTEGDDSIEQTNKLHKWFEACGADFSGTDKTGERATHSSIQEILQNRYGSHYTCVEVFDPLSRVPGDKDGVIESKNLPFENLNPEDKAIANELINLGDDDPVENIPLLQPVKETMPDAGNPRRFQERFAQQEWETLQLAFLWVFRMTFGVIRKSDCFKLDEKTMMALGGVIARAPALENDLAREVMISLAGDFENIWMRCLNDPRLPHEALKPIAQLLQDKVSAEEARGFKQAILIMTRVVAEAADRKGYDVAAVVMPAVHLYPNVSTDEILSEVGMTTSRNIYKRPSDSSADQAVARPPAESKPVSVAAPAIPVAKATPEVDQAEISPTLNAVIQKYLSREYTLVSRTDTSAILKRQSPINWGIFILLLIVFWIGAIVYLLARKKYQVTLVEQLDGGVLETGGTLEEFEADRARDASRPKSAFYMIVFGVLLTVVGGFFGLILLLSHLSDPVLSKDPMGTITTMLICPTPIVVIGLLMLAGGLFIRRRAEHAPGVVEQTAQAAPPRPTPQPTIMEQQVQVPASELVMAPVESEEVSTPHQASQSITEPGGSDLTELLNTLVNSQDRNSRHKAAASLEEQGWQPDNSEAGAAYWLANLFNAQRWEKCVDIGAPAVRPLLAELKDGTTWTDKACAAEALSKITPRLENEEARQLVLETFLKEIADASRFTNAATLLSGNMADLWNADKLRIYIAAAQALGVLANEKAVQPLIAGLNSKQAPRLHDAILEALVKIGEPSVEPLLTVLKSSENDDVRKEAAEALKQLGWTPDKTDDKVDQHRPGPAVASVLGKLENPDMTARLIAIGQAGVLLAKNEPGALEPFLVILRDKEQVVRMTALAYLWKLDKNILHTALEASGKASEFRSILTELANGDSLEADDAKRVLANISE